MVRKSYGTKSLTVVLCCYVIEILLITGILFKSAMRLQHSRKTGMALFLSPNSILIQAMLVTLFFLVYRILSYSRDRYVRVTLRNGFIRFHRANPFTPSLDLPLRDIQKIHFRAERRNYAFLICTQDSDTLFPLGMSGVTMRNLVDDLRATDIPISISGKFANFYIQDRKIFNRRALITLSILGFVLLYVAFLLLHTLWKHRQ